MDFLDYWGLKEKPFENTGDPKFFFYSPTHKEALIRLIYVIREAKAGALMAGDYGTGKTTIANELLFEINESNEYQSVYIKNPLLSPPELLQDIAYQLNVGQDAESRLELRRTIEEKMKRIASDGKHTIIIVDEAHLMSRKDVLEELRLMMNINADRKFLATIIMMGQLELREIINSMPQFKQRFAMFYVLKQLDIEQTVKYVEHRLDIAGATRPIFDDEARQLIFDSSAGRPRQINNICDMALLVGYMKRAEGIDAELVRDVVKDLGGDI
ncbi:MAG: AAA family ATPase [Candidatus Tantalella remota]|nr:AAA family ATPase [Candidatus Tantalella remota]